jgi:hypothetical protein
MLISGSEITFDISGCWQKCPFHPGVNVVVIRGEGNNGVITVDVPTPDGPIGDPTDLPVSAIKDFDLDVCTGPDTQVHYGKNSLETGRFLLYFSLAWADGTYVNYRIRVNC